MSESFDVNSFLAQLESDKPKEFTSDRINKVLMNARDNQGTVVFIPFLNKRNNNFYYKLNNVLEWRGATSIIEAEQAWYKILSKEEYGKLSQEDSDLYDEVEGLWNTISGYDKFSYDKIRRRNYTIFYGIVQSHKNQSGNEITKHSEKPCLLIFPSHSPIDALNSAIAAKCQTLKGNKEWITAVLSPATTGRKGVVSVVFKKSSGAGYDTQVNFEINSDYSIIVDPSKNYDEEVKLFDDPVRDLLGWQGGDNNALFNRKVFTEAKADMQIALKKLSNSANVTAVPENIKETTTSPEVKNEGAENKVDSDTQKLIDDLPF